MQEAANKGKDAGRCPACGRVSLSFLHQLVYNKRSCFQKIKKAGHEHHL